MKTLNTSGETVKPEQGFTLIELLVVIAVIAILAAMLLPALAKAKLVSQETYCKNSTKQIATAICLYCTDSRERIPLVTEFGRQWYLAYGNLPMQIPGYNPGQNPVYLPNALFPYVGTNINATDSLKPAQMAAYRPQRNLFCCPSAITIQADSTDSSDQYFDAQYFADNDGVTYLFMAVYYDIDLGMGDNPDGQNNYAHPVSNRKTSQIVSPATAVEIWEIPYHNWNFQPHFKGQTVCHPDGSVNRFKGYATMTDWYFENSEYGWDTSRQSPHPH